MCGITGIFDTCGGGEISQAVLQCMNNAQHHRGPDEGSLHIEPGLGFGHRRLSIIDIATGQQPLFNEDGSVAVVFNGEIYNYQDLIPELQALGHVFHTKSDTEVIVHAWEQWGERDIDPLAVEEYFALGYVAKPRSIFRQALKLPTGHSLVIRRGQPLAAPREYWDVRFTLDNRINEQDAQAEMIERLRESVRLRMIAEVPLGAFLSGGVDSSAVVALMAGPSNGPVNTCSMVFNAPKFNESEFAQLVADRYRTKHRVETVASDDIDLIDTLARPYDEPYADSSAIPTYRVCQLASKHVTVTLSDDGGDETFGGYRRYRLPLIQYLDTKTYLVGDINTKVDRASMAHSLEVREPLMDHELVQWAATLPSSLKVRGAEGLKKAMKPHLPDAVLYRPKMGFAVPLARWSRGPLKAQVLEAIQGPRLVETGGFNRDYLQHRVDAHQSGARDYNSPLWTLLMFEAFLRKVVDAGTHSADQATSAEALA